MKNENQINRRGFIINGIKSIVMGAAVFIGGLFKWKDAGAGDKNLTFNNRNNVNKSSAELQHYTEIMKIPLKSRAARGVAVGADGDIYAAADNCVQIYSKDGKLKSNIVAGSEIYALALDKMDDIYLGMSKHVEVFNKTGTQKAVWESPGKDAIITSIAVSEEFVFVADAGHHIVWKYDKAGKVLLRIGEKNEKKDIPGFIVPSPFFGVSIDPDGFLWIANPGRHSLENYTFEGDLRTSWGKYSMEIDDFCGCCNPSNITILENGKFLTSEKGIPRVKIYNRIGLLESVVAGPEQFRENTKGIETAEDADGRIYISDPENRSIRIFEKKKV